MTGAELRKAIKADTGDKVERRKLIRRAYAMDRMDLVPSSWGADIQQASTSADMAVSSTAPGPHGGVVGKGSGTKGSGSAAEDDLNDELRRKQKLTQPSKPVITNQAQLKSAIREALTAGDKLDPRVAKTITARAYALGFSSLLPKGGVMAEFAIEFEQTHTRDGKPKLLAPFLLLEGGVPGASILQEGSPDNGGRMKIKVPFFVGNSVSVAPGFDRRLYFSKELLPGIIQEAKAQIGAGNQPLNVYARHKHAMTGDHLPIGAVVDVEAEGRVGYATIELEPIVPDGVNAMTLIRGKKLNAVSLRSREGSTEVHGRSPVHFSSVQYSTVFLWRGIYCSLCCAVLGIE